MSVFRSPLYLDVDTLVPMANYHDIEVMVDVAVTQRDLGQRSGGAAVKVKAPIPGSPGLELGGSRGAESELTQARTIKDHPTNALNRLLDALAKNGDVTTDLTVGAIRRHQAVELNGDWEISSAADAGSFLKAVVGMIAQNPALMEENNSEVPPELYSLLTSAPTHGSIVLDAILGDSAETHVLALLDAGCLVGTSTIDDLEGDRTIFGQVDALVGAESRYSLDKFFLSGIGRPVRRAIPMESLLGGMAEALGKPMTMDDLKIDGPLIVVKAIAIY